MVVTERIAGRRQIHIADMLIIVLCVLGAYQLAEKPSSGALFHQEGTNLTVAASFPDDRLHIGDLVITVAGYHVASSNEVEQILDQYAIGDTVAVSIIRDGVQMVMHVELEPWHTVVSFVLVVISGGIFLFLGIFVLNRRPNEIAAHLFHWVSAGAAVLILASWGRYTSMPPFAGLLPRMLFFSAYAFVPVLFIHFAFHFPREKYPARRMFLGLLYLIAVVITLGQAFTHTMFVSGSEEQWLDAFILSFNWCQRFMIAGMVLGIVVFLHSAFTTREETERRKLRLVIAGMIGPMVFVLLYVLPVAFGRSPVVPEAWSMLFSMTAPISFAISFVAYNLMDIDVFLRRSTVYFFGFAGLVLVFGALDVLIMRIFGPLGVGGVLVVSLLSIAIYMVMLEPRRGMLLKAIERRFFRINYDFRITQRDFTDHIKQFREIDVLGHFIVDRVNAIIPVERISMFLIAPSGLRLQVISHHGFEILERFGVEFHPDQLRAELRLPVALPEYVEAGARYEHGDVSMFNRWHIALVLAMLNEEGQIIGFLVLGRKKSKERFSLEDMDLLTTIAAETGLAIERIQLQEKLIIARTESRQLKELSDLKSYFVSSVSHELKTPLTSIRMFAEMLEERILPGEETMHKYLRVIVGEADRLSRLISDVLDYAKIERGEKTYQLVEQPLQPIIEDTLALMEYQVSMRKFGLTTEFALPDAIVYVDRDAVQQAVINLLSNALKYSGDSKRITLSTRHANGSAVVSVKDYGTGIGAEDIHRLSSPFFRLDQHKTIAGAGLGLSIVRHIMNAHRGSLKVHSVEGEGSTFSLYFPLTRSDDTLFSERRNT